MKSFLYNTQHLQRAHFTALQGEVCPMTSDYINIDISSHKERSVFRF
jgi:hypothetical protein